MSPAEMQRLVDNLSRMYAVIVGLAIVEGLKKFLNIVPTGSAKVGVVPQPKWEFLPEAIATFLTILAFFHGMNRYMDVTYLPGPGKLLDRPTMFLLMFDFTMFFLESCLLLAVGLTLCSERLATFKALALLFVYDGIWCALQYFYYGGANTPNWLILDAVVAAILIGMIVWKGGPRIYWKARILCLICLAKIVVDYYLGWSFYFPASPRPG
jgi:hypothetical protein